MQATEVVVDTGRRRAAKVAKRRRTRALIGQYGVLGALVLAIVVFALLRPDTFPTSDNMKAILSQMAPVAVVAFGLTVVLVLGDFDLSIVGMIGLSSAVVISLMSNDGVPMVLALATGLALAVGMGLLNGALIAGLGASSFIITLATGQVFDGLELQITDGQTLFERIPDGYLDIATAQVLGLDMAVWVALVVFIVIYLLLEHSQPGRYMYAIGGNAEAAPLSGIAVTRTRIVGFAISALCTLVAAVLLTGQAGAYSSDLGTSYFLPTYAAVFLGAAVFRPGSFNVVGTLVGALLLEVIASGLTLMSLSNSVVLIVQGGILAAAVLLSTLQRRVA